MDKQNLILIGVPNGSGSFPAVMVTSLLTLHKPVSTGFMIVERQMIEIARNGICQEALKVGATHVLMLDDDNPIPPDTLEKLLEDDKDIVIAPILSRNPSHDGRHALCAFYKREIEGVKLYDNVTVFKEKGDLHQIDAGGTGCMLIKIDVIKKLSEKFKGRIFERTHEIFDKPITVDGKEYTDRTMSEDCLFCERAVEEGFEVWLDSRVKPLHITGNKLIQWQEHMQ